MPSSLTGISQAITSQSPQGISPQQRPTPLAPSLAPSTSQSQEAQSQEASEALAGVERLMAKVMNELNSAKPANLIAGQIKQTGLANGVANELANLAGELEKEPSLAEAGLKIKELLKPVADISPAELAGKINNSGVAMEAKLANALSLHALPPEINKLFNDIKNLSNPQILAQILNLAEQNDDENTAFKKLNTIIEQALDQAKQNLQNSSLQKALVLPNKLDNIASYLAKLRQAPSAKDAQKMAKAISNTLLEVKSKTQALSSPKLASSTAFSANLSELNKSIQNIQNELKSLQTQNQSFERLFVAEQSLGDKLKSLARRLSAMLELIDPKASKAKTDISELKALARQQSKAAAQVGQISPNDSQAIAQKIASQDLKAILLNAQQELANSSNESAKSALARVLSGIELNQMLSNLTGSLSSFLPYSWDALDGSRVAFKRGKKERFFAQIELNFKAFGAINAIITLSNKHQIDISAAAASQEFVTLIKQNKPQLQSALQACGLVLSQLNIKAMPKRDIIKEFEGFDGINLGVNRRV